MAPLTPYVYALVDPRDDAVFYIGKGTGRRMYVHERDVKRGKGVNAAKCQRIKDILDAGLKVEHRVLGQYQTESGAYEAEMTLIAQHTGLTNANAGGGGSWLCGDGDRQENYSKVMAKAREMLFRVKPYMDWVNEKPRSNQEDDWYHMIIREFHDVIAICERKLAPNGQVA